MQLVDAELGMTPELQGIVDSLRAVDDDRTRFKQLLFMAAQCPPMAEELKTPENKVQGCLSTVHVHAELRDGKVYYSGDSDGQMTKGLVAMLVKGLSGSGAAEIADVKPEFIKTAGLGQSLTPGRNNGFINMLAKMKAQALELTGEGGSAAAADSAAAEDAAPAEEAGGAEGDALEVITTFEEQEGRPLYNACMAKLIAKLKPVELELRDESHQHSGHAGMEGSDAVESHFSLHLVSDIFKGMTRVKRQQLVFAVLAEEMKTIHALQMTTTKTPEEEGLI